ncbi:hypothetical protein [Dactylosporangium sp. CA-139066]|uniref:hypothetical protein n=1 Tax=Dactylosporangium sp. CA-139066 TaxID=3239930 RepID=UPI003D8F1CF5
MLDRPRSRDHYPERLDLIRRLIAEADDDKLAAELADLAAANDDVWREDGALVCQALDELPAARRQALILRLADPAVGSLLVGLAAGIGPDALSWGAARLLADAVAQREAVDPGVLGAVAEVTRRETGEVPAALVAVMRRTTHRYTKHWPVEDWPRLRPWLEPFAGVLSPGEAWAEAANAEAPSPELLAHALAASGARPAPRWARRGAELVAGLGGEPVRARIRSWCALVPRPRTIPLRDGGAGLADPNQVPDPYNARALRGLVYLLSVSPHHPDDVPAVGRLAQHAAEKVPGHGPRSQMVALACVYALERFTTLPALRELARLRSVGQPTGIAAALTGAIARRSVALNVDPGRL